MAKDQTKLQGVSDYFTEQTLENILCTMCNGNSARVLSWDFGEASAKGDSYLSTVNKIKLTGVVDGKDCQVSIVVKSLPKNLGRRKTFRSTEFFHNEIIFYTKIVPKFKEFLNAKDEDHLLCIPRCVASFLDGENDFLALEDVSVLGYGSVSRQNCINVTQCEMLLRAMAKFHAISFAYKDQNKAEFTEVIEKLHETYFDDKYWEWYKNFQKNLIGIASNALSLEYPGHVAEKRFASYKFGELFQKSKELCSRKNAPTSVISQGDSWAPNFLARNTNDNEQDAMMLDFQLARCASPILDLSFCIYSCTDKQLWDNHFDEMLKLYHTELTNSISLLGSDPEKLYSWDTFMDEVKEQFLFGLTFALEAVPFSILDESESFDLDALIKDDNGVDVADVFRVTNIKSKDGRLRLANIIVHAVEKGFL